MTVRDGTDDFAIFKEVCGQNEYRLPDSLDGQTVLDIGAHAGFFAIECARRGAKKVVCYEMQPSNFWMLKQNTMPYDGIEVHPKAVWRSDRKDKLWSIEINDRYWTSIGRTLPGGDLEPVSLDSILQDIGYVDLLKIDCEGAEWPILYTCKELGRVRSIAGELHCQCVWNSSPFSCSGEGMTTFLDHQGFVTEVVTPHKEWSHNKLFFARRA